MAIDIKAVTCPQCGSSDVNMVTEAEGLCKACGIHFAVKPRIETQNVYNEVHYYREEEKETEFGLSKSIITPNISKQEFLREAWVSLAREDAPLDVFKENFSEPEEVDHQVLMDSITADTSYRVTVGYDRQEPYIDYETYYEDEPYLTTESYYDYNTHSNRTRQVTKYRKVARQRQITRYKTVTDWQMTDGQYDASSVVLVENLPGKSIDDERLIKGLKEISEDNYIKPDEETADSMRITESTNEIALSRHKRLIGRLLERSLPGDHYRDLDWRIDRIKTDRSFLYNLKEYETTIRYNGETYRKRAYSFGKISVDGDSIRNDVDLYHLTEKMRDALESRKKERYRSSFKKVEKSTNLFSFITIGLLALSIILSIFVRVTAVIVAAYVVAALAFAANFILIKKKESDESDSVYKANKDDEEKTENEIDELTTNYKSKLLETLNDKLKSLGLEPASLSDIAGNCENDYDDEEDYS